MFARIYLVLVSLLYMLLAIACSIWPEATSNKVGFELLGDSGQSEFLTVYGGLEFGLALVLLSSLIVKDMLKFGVVACVLIHASLVGFRTVSLFLFSGVDPFTYRLAAGEWFILLSGMAILCFSRWNIAAPQVGD